MSLPSLNPLNNFLVIRLKIKDEMLIVEQEKPPSCSVLPQTVLLSGESTSLSLELPPHVNKFFRPNTHFFSEGFTDLLAYVNPFPGWSSILSTFIVERNF